MTIVHSVSAKLRKTIKQSIVWFFLLAELSKRSNKKKNKTFPTEENEEF